MNFSSLPDILDRTEAHAKKMPGNHQAMNALCNVEKHFTGVDTPLSKRAFAALVLAVQTSVAGMLAMRDTIAKKD